jgi:hypothetical protein
LSASSPAIEIVFIDIGGVLLGSNEGSRHSQAQLLSDFTALGLLLKYKRTIKRMDVCNLD